MAGRQYFGASFDAPAYEDATAVATPVGESCYECGETVAKGDDGWIDFLAWGARYTAEPIHRECDLRRVVGHLVGVCPCSTDWQPDSLREQAREAARRWEARGGR